MSSEKFREFLEIQSRRSPLRITGHRLSWEERGERPITSESSDFLESVYLGKELQSTVVMEHSVAAMLQQRLTELERDNERLRKSVSRLKIALGFVVAVALIALWTYSKASFLWV